MQLQWTTTGRYAVSLSIAGKRFSVSVHRMVAMAFIGPPPDGEEVNHLDGICTNNHATNLEWVTHIENRDHAVENGLISHGSQHWLARLTEDLVREIRARYSAGGISQRALASEYEVSEGTIHYAIMRKNWKHVP